ncbi:MAG: SIS domain-containing protein [Anaerolineales bacterium]
MSWIDQEINEQPQVIAGLLQQDMRAIVAAIQAFDPTFVMIVARGTSDNAAHYAKYIFGLHLGWPVMLATPSLYTLYNASLTLARALVIGISQSGQSTDILAVMDAAQAQGALTLSITNDATSPMATRTDFHLDIAAGPERSVAATKSYTAQLTAIAALSAQLSNNPGHAQQLATLPDAVQQTLDLNAQLAPHAERYRYMQRFAVIGRGVNHATAYEISLKIKELCYIPGEEYSEADFRHGPIAMIEAGFPIFLVMPDGKTYHRMLDLLQLLHDKGAECICITNRHDGDALAHKTFLIPSLPEWLSAIVAVIPGQLFAKHLATAKGHALDTPRGLNKVTRTQ